MSVRIQNAIKSTNSQHMDRATQASSHQNRRIRKRYDNRKADVNIAIPENTVTIAVHCEIIFVVARH